MEGEVERTKMLGAQRNEKTEHIVYERFSRITKDAHNREVLLRLAEEELKHHDAWRLQTGTEVRPHHVRIQLICLLTRVMGMSFGLKLMERSQTRTKTAGRSELARRPGLQAQQDDEDDVERQLLRLIDEERLKYVGAVVMGLSDALVELTGALAGFTFAMQSPRAVAAAGLITGIAAALSMGGTGYLTAKSEESARSPVKSAMYTGLTYIVTVLLLVLPYLFSKDVYVALGLTILIASAIMLVFSFYMSVTKEVSFRERFREMMLLTLGIAGLSFGVGLLVKNALGVQT